MSQTPNSSARFINIGERTNVTGSAAFKKLVMAGDYAAAVDAQTLLEPDELAGEIRLIIAAQVGRPRLLDNLGVNAPGGAP